ncbi:YHYH protein [Phycisphaeraceae bacterium D3-23]
MSMPTRLFLPAALIALATPYAAAHPAHGDAAPGDYAADGDTGFTFAIYKLADENEVTIEVRGDYRFITANGIPDHRPGRFPNRGNPNAISAQQYRYRVPVSPEQADEPTDAAGQPFGIGLNGVPFDPGTAEFWEPGMRIGERGRTRGAWNYEAMSGVINLGLDEHNAHVQPTGAYHYHGVPMGLAFNGAQGDEAAMVMVGYAADGFPMYAQFGYQDADDAASEVVALRPSYRLKEGNRPTGDDGPGGAYDGTFTIDYEYVEGLGDLDECNGRFGVTPEYPGGTYYYVITEVFPHIPRLFKGTPDESFERRRGPGRGGPGGREGRPGSGGPGAGGPEGERPPRRGPREGRPPRG